MFCIEEYKPCKVRYTASFHPTSQSSAITKLLRAQVQAELEKPYQKNIGEKMYLMQKRKNPVCSVILFWEAETRFRKVRLYMLTTPPLRTEALHVRNLCLQSLGMVLDLTSCVPMFHPALTAGTICCYLPKQLVGGFTPLLIPHTSSSENGKHELCFSTLQS